MRPYSVAVNPPVDPPTVVGNPKRNVVIDFDTTASTNGDYAVQLSTIRNALKDQLSITETPNFVIRYVHVWAKDQVGSSVQLTDLLFATTSRGDATIKNRARAGINYPRNVQPIYPRTIATDPTILILTSSPAATNPLTFRIGVTYWTS